MKKSFQFISIAIFLISLSACISQPPSLDERGSGIDAFGSGSSVNSYTGVIKTLEIDIYQDGTHQIETETGVVVIQSPTVNLNNYIGKKVTVKGSVKKMIDNIGKVFTVNEIALEGPDGEDEKEYESVRSGLRFTYPTVWILIEDAESLALRSGGINRVSVEIFSTEERLDDFISSREIEDGTSVTVGSVRSIRYVEEDVIRIYIPNEAKKKIYLITFNKEGDQDGTQKELFYALLENFELSGAKTQEGEVCGGEEAIECPEGYRCELESDVMDAEGICVSLEDALADPGCPFVPIPSGCDDYSVKSTNKDGCPTNYICNDSGQAEETAPSEDASVGMPYEALAEEEEAPSVSEDMRLYENPHKDYTLQYPKNWYYQSFGATEGSLWAVGFGENPVEEYSDAVIRVEILDGADSESRSLKGDQYIVILPRDEDSHFSVQGSLSLKETIEKMAESIIIGY